MSRVIKFRGQMTTGEWIYGLPHLDLPGSTAYFNECSYRICWIPETGGGANAPIKNGTLGQFTGMVDKNNKEIYEGDVVQTVRRTEYSGNDLVNEEVEFLGAAFYPICTEPSESWEVIGNVYEDENILK